MQTQSTTISSLTETGSAVDFESFYHSHLPRVYNFFRYQFGDDQIAEDLTAMAFEKAWKHRDQYRADLASFSTWLFRIARRIAVDHYRKRRITVALDDVPIASDTPGVEDIAQRHADLAFLAKLLARLADRERELVALKYGADLTNRAIASISGLSESNVGTILHRAVQQLREQWEHGP